MYAYIYTRIGVDDGKKGGRSSTKFAVPALREELRIAACVYEVEFLLL